MTTPTNAQIPIFDAASGEWLPQTMSGDATISDTGVVTVTSSGGPQIVSVPFTFATPSPVTSLAVNAGSIIARAQISITTPFNDPAATLQFGTSASPSLVMAAADSVPSSIGDYPKNTFVTAPASDTLQLTISPGASTQGAGILYYEVKV